MVGRLARYFHGGLSIPAMMKMTYREVHFWHKLHERQIAGDTVIQDCVKKEKPIPDGKAFENAVDRKIKEWYSVNEE